MAQREAPVLKRWKRIVALGLLLFGTCAGLAAGEVILRVVGPRLWERLVGADLSYPWIGYHPILGWVNRPGTWATGFLINALGFRGPETSPRKPSGWLRIVCLGDSRTFGLWADGAAFRYDNDYPAALESLLHERGEHGAVEVINAGVIGYTSAQGLAQLQTQLLLLHPDIITVAFGFNDHSLAWNTALAAREPHNPLARELFYLASHSYLFRLGKAEYDALPSLHAPPFSERWVDREAYRYNLRRLAEVGTKHGIHVLFVNQALRPIELGESPEPNPNKPGNKLGLYQALGVRDLEDLHRVDRSYQDVLYKVAEENGVPVADASVAFAERHESLFGPSDLVHCNPTGARVIAETIQRKLVELGWLPSPESVSAISAGWPGGR
jgi:lysophospholipase L1-like esterase